MLFLELGYQTFISTWDISIFLCISPIRVRTGHGKPGKTWNLRISFSRPGKSWNFKALRNRLVMHLSMSSPRWGRGGSGKPREFYCGIYPNFIREKRSKPFVSANFDNSFSPWGGDFDNFFRKCQNLHPMPDPPPPLGLDTDRCITANDKVLAMYR